MNTKHKLSSLTIVSLIAVIVFIMNSSFAFGAEIGDTAPNTAPGDIQAYLATIYATRFEVSFDEALHRLKIQDSFPGLQPALMENEPDTFGGLWIQHEPEYKIVIAFTHDGQQVLSKYKQNISEETARHIELSQVSVSLATLLSDQQQFASLLKTYNILSNSRVDITNNCVSVDIVKAYRYDFENCILYNRFILPNTIKVSYVDEPTRLTTDIYGGLSMSTATTGFSVYDWYTGNKYIATCGHIYDSFQNIIDPNDQNTFYNTYVPTAYQFSGSYDCELRSPYNGALNITNKVRYWEDGSTLNVTSIQPRLDTIVGSIISKYGRTTHYTAGQISNIYGFPYDIIPNCNATWVEVNNVFGYQTLTDVGDSGGPWFSGGTAYGIQSYNRGTYVAGFMSVSYLPFALGVNVMTSP